VGGDTDMDIATVPTAPFDQQSSSGRWRPRTVVPSVSAHPKEGVVTLAPARPDATTGPSDEDPRDPHARLATLLDPGTVTYLAGSHESGVRTARGEIDGLAVHAFATDPTRMGGAMSAEGCGYIVDTINAAVAAGTPVIGVWHSGGARLPDGVAALDGVGRVFAAMTAASGRVPQLSVVLGPAAGGAAYGPALTDIVVMSGDARIFVTGPEVVRIVTGEEVDMEQLGGPATHAQRSGVAHVVARDDAGAIESVRRLAVLLGRPGRIDVTRVPHGVDLGRLLPTQSNRAYDVRPLVKALLDEKGLELHGKWAPNIVTTLGRFAGRTVGVIANNPLRMGGCLDSCSAEKAARFVRMCDAFKIPLVVLVDVPGYLPGVGQEWDGVVRRGAKLLHAFAEAVVPRITLVTRKAYGGAYIAMNSRALGATAVYAWPDAEIAVMGPAAAVGVLHRRRLAAVPPEARDALRERLVEEQRRTAGGVERAMEVGVVDDIVTPEETHKRLAETLATTATEAGDHGNIPL
jgi:acetyl-CoA/propionyl-CoA carboxylase carboxyl transferase subunit